MNPEVKPDPMDKSIEEKVCRMKIWISKSMLCNMAVNQACTKFNSPRANAATQNAKIIES